MPALFVACELVGGETVIVAAVGGVDRYGGTTVVGPEDGVDVFCPGGATVTGVGAARAASWLLVKHSLPATQMSPGSQ